MTYCILTGEQSGDQLGAKLISHLNTPCFGMGSTPREHAGCELIEHPLHVMGFIDVAKALPSLLKQFKHVEKEILKRSPKAVITIDNPDFNFIIAKKLRKKGYRGKLIHMVSPSVWAWRQKRVYTLAKRLDHLLTILPFEKAYYEKTSLDVTYIGHPLVNAASTYTHTPLNLPQNTIALFPGSRKQEIIANLPLQLAATKNHPIAISVARPDLSNLIKTYTDAPQIPSEKRYDLMHEATAALATSGTIVLELALHATPTVVTYKLSSLNYFLARTLFKIHLPYYTLPNLICKQEVFPEFIHKTIAPTDIQTMLTRITSKPKPCIDACHTLRQQLNLGDSSEHAAKLILSLS